MTNSYNILLNSNPCGLLRYLLVNHGVQAAPEVCQDMLVKLQVALNDRPGIEWTLNTDDDEDLIVLDHKDIWVKIVDVAVHDIICGYGDLPRVRLGVLNSCTDVLHDHLVKELNRHLWFKRGTGHLYQPTMEHLATLVAFINLRLDPEGLGDIVWVDDEMNEQDLVLWAPPAVPDDIDRSMFGPDIHDYIEGCLKEFARNTADHMKQVLAGMDLNRVHIRHETPGTVSTV